MAVNRKEQENAALDLKKMILLCLQENRCESLLLCLLPRVSLLTPVLNRACAC